MATFTEDFTRMREDFDQSHQDRQEFVQGIIDDEVEDCKNRQEFCQQVRDDVAEMRQENRSFMNTVLKPFAADLKAGGAIFRGGRMA